ncbi:hypothetical protein N8T08_004182 [Aspergillus melleus]|uniref:Uncharacterized protein n=1 Tax=Aspergillus melleus TaxID=138277 RepID=A0ACC3B5X7_9EURO|nr:hypothetical protein N8T08_004182 [Aspergillus melleus]
MQLDSLDDWILYIERNPLVILFLVLASWLFSLWNRRQLDIYSYESSPESRGYPPIEPLPDFNWETAEPLCFRPFKPKYHLTMGKWSLL